MRKAGMRRFNRLSGDPRHSTKTIPPQDEEGKSSGLHLIKGACFHCLPA